MPPAKLLLIDYFKSCHLFLEMACPRCFVFKKASPSLLGGGPSSLNLKFVRTWFHVGAKAVLWWAKFVLSLAS